MANPTRPVTDEEFETHVVPMAAENWSDAHDGRDPYRRTWDVESDADYAEMLQWAAILRENYDTGAEEISWR